MERGLEIEKLKGSENYHTWAFAIRNVLALKGHEHFIIAEKTDDDETKKSACKAILSLSVDKQIYVHIQSCDSPIKIWKTLQNLFEDKGLSRKISLLRNLISTRLDSAGSMQSYIDALKTHSTKLIGIGFALSDEWLAAIILAGLSDDYRPFIMGLEASGKELQSDSIISKLLDSTSNTESKGDALFGKGKNSKKNKGDKSIKCHYCKKKGHMADVCRKKKADEKKENEGSAANAAFIAHINAHEIETAYAAPRNTLSPNVWYVDSGASSHMTPHGKLLSNIQPSAVNEIMSANSEKLKVNGAGTTTLNLNGSDIPVSNVLHVPGLAANLLSVHHIASKGNSVLFDFNGCTIRNSKAEIIAQCKPSNGVYKIDASANVCMQTMKLASAHTWHRRLGHMNWQRMKSMRDGAVDGMSFSDDTTLIQNCEVCAYGKQARLPFQRSETQTKRVLELIHSDVMGPMETSSIGNAKYILNFVDDFSKKTFVYFLKAKSDVLETFKSFKALVEKQTDQKIVKFRSDNGTEYRSKLFEDFCKKEGIQHQFTTVYTPQQNGVAERMNRTIVEKAKCLLFDAGLPKCYWAEASNMAVYLINKSISAAHGKVPDEIFTGKRVNLSNLKLFGSIVMVHIPGEKRKKWDKKSEKLIFVGYDDNTKGYRCIDKQTRKLIISRDVIFHESTSNESITFNDSNDEVRASNKTADEATSSEQITPVEKLDESGNSEFENANDTITGTSPDNTLNDPEYQPDETIESIPRTGIQTRSQTASNIHPFDMNPINFAFFIEPSTVTEAMKSSDANKWKRAMDEEMSAHRQNATWSLATLPKGRKAIKAKWVFKSKTNEDGHIIRYKARLVAKGCSQKPGIDYSETFSPVVRYNSIRFLMSLAVRYDLKIHQMDAVTAFLQGDLDEEIFMEQPEHYDDGSGRVCRLNRSIYGLKQAGRQWNHKLDQALRKFGLNKSKLDPCIYFSGKLSILIAIYVDDFLIFFKCATTLSQVKQYLNSTFKMKDLGVVSSCIGMRIKQFENIIEIDQTVYVQQILERFGMTDSKPVKTPSDASEKLTVQTITAEDSLVGKVPYQEAVGSLLYLAQSTRPDIAFAVGNVSRFNSNHGSAQWRAVKRIFRYLRGTPNAKLRYTKSNDGIVAYTDSDWGSEIDDRRSCSGYVVKLSNAAICWMSKRQPIVALSSTEAEYIALSSTACELVWLKQLADELYRDIAKTITVCCDNQSTIKLALSDAYRPRSKHIDVRHHYIRELVEAKVIHMKYVPTTENAADALTKPVPAQKTDYCNAAMGMHFDEQTKN